MKFEQKSSTLRSQMAVLCTVLVVPATLAYAPQSSVPNGGPANAHAVKPASARQQTTRQGGNLRPSAPEVHEPSLAERARTLASLGRIGSLSTHSGKFAGFPYGSMMPYAVDERGRPVFFISSMAMHTQNLLQDPRASLLITQPDVSGEPLDAARVTLIGTAAEVPAAEVRALYLSRYENAKLWQDFSDFAYYRLEITGVYFVGGFGVVGWIAAGDYESARPDPSVDAAAGIIQHMHADHAGAVPLAASASTVGSSPAGAGLMALFP